MSKKLKLLSLVALILVVAAYFILPIISETRAIARLVDRNIDARGGYEAWQKVKAMRLKGQMEVGEDAILPYSLEQQRPNKMCLKFVFNEETTTQCSTGDSGWKIVPFRGRHKAEALSEKELADAADAAEIYGLLYDYSKRGNKVEILGHETINGKDTIKLKITLPRGAERWLYLDSETALDVKLESLREVRGKPRLVETFYKDWQETEEGLLISRLQETKTQGDDKFYFLTVETVEVNPEFTKGYFDMPKKDNKE